MRKLQDQSGVQAPSADYLKGRIVNKQTKVNEEILGDIIEAVHKMVDYANITENGNPDNETNGHQVLEALIGYLVEDTDFIEVLNADYSAVTPFPQAQHTQPDARNLSYRKTKDGYLEIRGEFYFTAAPSGNDLVFSLPVGYRPIVENRVMFLGVDQLYGLTIKTNGDVVFTSSIGAANNVFVYGKIPLLK